MRYVRFAPVVAGVAVAVLVIWLIPPQVLQRMGLDGEWRFIAGTLDGSAILVLAEHPTTLSIAEGRLSGHGPCNEYGGDLDVNGSALHPHDVFQTLAACIDPQQTAAEVSYFAALDRAALFHRDGPRLVLVASGVELKFELIAK